MADETGRRAARRSCRSSRPPRRSRWHSWPPGYWASSRATTDYDGMRFAGHDSTAMLLGVFQVSVLHNLVHLLFGAVGLVLARTLEGARNYLIGGGRLPVLWLYGVIVDEDLVATRTLRRTSYRSTGPTTGYTSGSGQR